MVFEIVWFIVVRLRFRRLNILAKNILQFTCKQKWTFKGGDLIKEKDNNYFTHINVENGKAKDSRPTFAQF